jgi:hypothetical protein
MLKAWVIGTILLALLVLGACDTTSAPEDTMTSENKTAPEDTAAPEDTMVTEEALTFQQTVDLLDNPEKLSEWMLDNIQIESHYEIWEETGVNYVATPEETFSNRVGCCAEFAVFACYVLEYHGYDAEILRIAVESNLSRNHAVCVYDLSGSLYSVNVGRIEGTFDSCEDVAFAHDEDWSEYDVYYSWEVFQQLGQPDEVVYR